MSRGNDPILALATTWSQELGNALEAMADERPRIEVVPGSGQPEGERVWWKQPLDASPGSVVWIGTAHEACVALGQQILSAAGVESSDPKELRETYLEVVRQSLGSFASVLGTQLNREVVCIEGSEEEPPRDRTAGCEVVINPGGNALPAIIFLLNKEMLEAVARSSPADPPAEEQHPAALSDEPKSELSPRASSTLNLLMDVELPVSVSFGRTRVRVQEILKLITGSIIELERSISEPVEVIVNNCVVARGEVVVVDGNYGVRINEVMSRRERLQESRRSLLPIHRSSAGIQARN